MTGPSSPKVNEPFALALWPAPADRSGLNVFRWLVRIGCLVVLTAMAWPGVQLWPKPLWPNIPGWIQSFERPESAQFVPALSTWIALSTLVGARTLCLAAGLGIGVGLVALLRRRWFCRWMCPMGVCTELAGRAGRLVRLRAFRLFPVGQWVALLTLAGAAVGYPLLLWMDPLALWAGWITPASVRPAPAVQPPPNQLPSPPPTPSQPLTAQPPQGAPQARIAHLNWFAGGVLLVLAIGFLQPGLWCGRLCPLGGMQEILWQLRQMVLQGIRRLVRLFRPGRGEIAQPAPAEPSRPFGRRLVLASLLGLLGAVWVRRRRSAESKPLRPPGATEEPSFSGLCIRCGNCIRACPARIILPDGLEHGLAAFLAPVVSLDQDYCREDCTRCTQACPTGALRPVALAEKPRVRIGLARVDMDRCLLGEARDCFICRERCPYQAIRTEFSPKTYMVEVRIDPGRCNGCGACQASCPTWPRAITVQPA